jgi:thiol-disulfide isomerase/thioredoxin
MFTAQEAHMKSATRRSLFALAFLAAPLSVARAFPDDGGAPAPVAPAGAADATKPVRDAWTTFQAAMKAMREAGRDPAKAKEAGAAYRTAQEAFAKAFAASDWNAFDAAADKELLQAGLSMTGNKALHQDHDAKTAIRAFETLVAKIPEAAAGANQSLARAYIADGNLAKARAALEASVAKGDGVGKLRAQLDLGDLLCAQGEMPAAQAAWKAVTDAVGADAKGPEGGARHDADMRVALIGKPAPDIDSKTWIDGEAKPLSALKGHVVLVDFWATWCPPCRDVMPELNKLYEAKKAAGLMVLGVTHYYERGFMPKPGTKDPMREGEQVKGLTEDTYLDHVKQFKQNVGITYPFALTGKDGAEANAYHVAGIPTMAVIDAKGDVAFLQVGSGDETLLKLVVDRLLAPAPAK